QGPLDPRPLFVRIAQAMVSSIRGGRLRPGDPLPGTRSLAQSLKVHRNTVLAAYNALAAEGWITTYPARGTFRSPHLPDPKPRQFSPDARGEIATRVGYALRPGPEMYRTVTSHPRGTLVFGGGLPDVRLVPTTELGRAYRRALRAEGRSLLGYSNSQ